MDDRSYRAGACDAILNRPYANPYGLNNFIRRASYLAGYLHGQSLMVAV